jgi:hypothetical protein
MQTHGDVDELFLVINHNLLVNSILVVKIFFIEWACSSTNGKMNTIYSPLNTGNMTKTFKSSHDCIHFGFRKPCNQVLKNNVDYCYDLLNNKGKCGSTYYKKFIA